jgi:hypothetical protein
VTSEALAKRLQEGNQSRKDNESDMPVGIDKGLVDRLIVHDGRSWREGYVNGRTNIHAQLEVGVDGGEVAIPQEGVWCICFYGGVLPKSDLPRA